MTRRCVVGSFMAGVILLAVGAALAKQGVVKTRNGQTYEGDISEQSGTVIVNRNGIETRLTQKEVASVSYPEDFDKQFAARLAKLEKNDTRGRVALAREAFDNGRYRLARDLLEEVLASDPNNAEAAQLRETVMAQIRLERARQAGPATAQARGPVTTMATTQAAEDQRFLRPRDINRIRQKEMLLDKNVQVAPANENIPIRFEHDVNRRYARDLAKRPAAEFLALTPLEQAREIFLYGPPEMQDDIKIMRDPQALFEYRRAVQPYVLQNCATSQCHGGSSGGRLQLFNPAESDPTTYTNFYILQGITKKAPDSGRVFSKGQLSVIDRMQPIRSLLLDYSIPMNLAEHTHPDVQGYRPPLRGPDDPRYRTMLAWISNSLRSDDPKYGIDYRVATSRPTTTQATTEPTSHPAVHAPNSTLRIRG